jgi:hypothetical protein
MKSSQKSWPCSLQAPADASDAQLAALAGCDLLRQTPEAGILGEHEEFQSVKHRNSMENPSFF